MRTREAHARWEGSLKEGSGEVDLGKGTIKKPYSPVSRALARIEITLEASLIGR